MYNKIIQSNLVSGVITWALIAFSGLLTCEGSRWKEQRRFALHTLRNYGFAKKSSENTIQFEMRELVTKFDAERGAIDPQYAVSGAVTNVISMLVFAERLAQNPEFLHINKLMNDAIGGVDLNAAGVLLQQLLLTVSIRRLLLYQSLVGILIN